MKNADLQKDQMSDYKMKKNIGRVWACLQKQGTIPKGRLLFRQIFLARFQLMSFVKLYFYHRKIIFLQ